MRRTVALVSAVLLTVGVAGCGGNDDQAVKTACGEVANAYATTTQDVMSADQSKLKADLDALMGTLVGYGKSLSGDAAMAFSEAHSKLASGASFDDAFTSLDKVCTAAGGKTITG